MHFTYIHISVHAYIIRRRGWHWCRIYECECGQWKDTLLGKAWPTQNPSCEHLVRHCGMLDAPCHALHLDYSVSVHSVFPGAYSILFPSLNWMSQALNITSTISVCADMRARWLSGKHNRHNFTRTECHGHWVSEALMSQALKCSSMLEPYIKLLWWRWAVLN